MNSMSMNDDQNKKGVKYKDIKNLFEQEKDLKDMFSKVGSVNGVVGLPNNKNDIDVWLDNMS